MARFLLMFLILLYSCSPKQAVTVNDSKFFDSSFVQWNKATLESLNRQIQSAQNSEQINKYRNRSIAVKGYWEIEAAEDILNSSIRYKLLQKIYHNRSGLGDFYVIEANESGSKVLLRSLVVDTISSGGIDVSFYEFINEEWCETGKINEKELYFSGDLGAFFCQFGKGFNHDDIVITSFRKSNIPQSEYYLYGTLSSESKVDIILADYIRNLNKSTN